VGNQGVKEDVLARFKNEVDGVSAADFQAVDLHSIARGEDVHPEVEKSTTGTFRALRSGQVMEGAITVLAKRGRKALPDLIRIANESGVEVLSIAVREPDLEAVFLDLTGRALRD
jgi:hypothetical protein